MSEQAGAGELGCCSKQESVMSEKTWAGELGKGVFKVNPVFVLVLGMCPTLAVSTSVVDALAMGVAASAVLLCSNTIISAARNLIPPAIRIPCYIVVIAAFVTAVELLMKAYLPPDINQRLGIFIPLIVVNCIILGRAEAFASSNTISRAIADALGIGLGFTGALCLVAAIREILGAGTLGGLKVSTGFVPASVMIMAPGAFLVLGLLLGFFTFSAPRIKALFGSGKGGE